MIICKTCQHENITGAIFCAACAAQLVTSDDAEREVTGGYSDDQNMPLLLEPGKRATFPEAPAGSWIALHFLDSNEIVPLIAGDQFTLGRVDDDQQFSPDIDLTPYSAWEFGVSRLHLAIRRGARHVTIRDLGSTNGTYLNGHRLKLNIDEVLHHGDFLMLGKLRIQILIRDDE